MNKVHASVQLTLAVAAILSSVAVPAFGAPPPQITVQTPSVTGLPKHQPKSAGPITSKRRSVAQHLDQIMATPTGLARVRDAERRGLKLQSALKLSTVECKFPVCIEATPARAQAYFEGFRLWAQHVIWEGNQYPSIYLRAADPDAPADTSSTAIRPRIFFQLQTSAVTWKVVTFEFCRAHQPPAPPFVGRVRARVLQGMVGFGHTILVPPSNEVELETFDSETLASAREQCFTLPVLAETRQGSPDLSTNVFTLELLQGELRLVRATIRHL